MRPAAFKFRYVIYKFDAKSQIFQIVRRGQWSPDYMDVISNAENELIEINSEHFKWSNSINYGRYHYQLNCKKKYTPV